MRAYNWETDVDRREMDICTEDLAADIKEMSNYKREMDIDIKEMVICIEEMSADIREMNIYIEDLFAAFVK